MNKKNWLSLGLVVSFFNGAQAMDFLPNWVKHHVLGNVTWYLPKFFTNSLLDIGANPDIVDSKGRSMLMYAARYADQSMVKTMLDHNANVLIADSRGKTALHWAMGEAESATGDLATANTRRTIVEQLVAKDAALVAKKDFEGNTPLHLAARYGFQMIIEHLLGKNADINAANNNGITPLMLATYNTQPDSLAIVTFLIQNGAKVATEDRQGWTAVLHAAKAGNQTVVTYLKSLQNSVPNQK